MTPPFRTARREKLDLSELDDIALSVSVLATVEGTGLNRASLQLSISGCVPVRH
jgi:hypothetical protein